MSDEDPQQLDDTGYAPPTVVRLGSLTELTRGGTTGADDGMGGAGDGGSL